MIRTQFSLLFCLPVGKTAEDILKKINEKISSPVGHVVQEVDQVVAISCCTFSLVQQL